MHFGVWHRRNTLPLLRETDESLVVADASLAEMHGGRQRVALERIEHGTLAFENMGITGEEADAQLEAFADRVMPCPSMRRFQRDRVPGPTVGRPDPAVGTLIPARSRVPTMTDDGDDADPDVPIHCPACETTTRVPLSEVGARVERHNEGLHDGEDVARVDPELVDQLADIVAEELGLV